MNILIDYDTYICAMAALAEQQNMALRLGHCEARWAQARKRMKAAMLDAVSRELDETKELPTFLRKQTT